jgi:hypothetical protein
MRLPVFAIASLVFCFSTASLADTLDEQALTHFEQGIELFSQEKYEQAAIAFERAYELKPSYKILYNIGQVQNRLEHYAAALEAYTRYLAEGGAEIEPARVDQVKAEIKRLNALVGMIAVTTNVEGATVFVDDEKQGQTPLGGPLFVDLGKHTVVIKQGTDELHREVVKVAGGQTVSVHAEKAAEEPEPQEPEPAAEQEDQGPKRVWTWVALGIGGAAAIGAGITGGLAASKKGDLDDGCPDKQCPASEQDTIDSMKTLAYTTDVLIGVAAVGIAAGIVLFFVEPGPGSDEEAVAVAPVVTPDGGGVALAGRF